ncbi:PAS domain S-box protein [Nocardioides sp. HDW12B]|uniref:PAS domain-containing protein n=1 Tax=Nocardioides sp. HDW12B TaxID=2714939 RepID=UPI00140AC9F4|nr:PAS domain S-box protein [Nocardioides sp. HDW12B]
MAEQAVVVTDTDGVIVYWSPGAEALLGWAADDALGRRVDLVIPPRFHASHWAGFERAMSDPQIKDMAADLPLLCADGSERHLAGRLLALPDGLGSAAGAVAVYTDADETGVRPFG